MAGKVVRDLRGKSGASKDSVGGRALPAAPRIKSGARCPSGKREEIKEGREGAKHSNPLMPGLRVRSDGWTAARTRVFLATLARTGCITDAARVAGVSTTSVNRSRALFAPFDKACEAAIAKALRGLEAVAYERAVEGREMVILRDGKEVERRIVPSDSILGLLIKRGDMKSGHNIQLTPEEAEAYVLPEAVQHRFLSREEFFRGVKFDKGPKGGKCARPTADETDAEILRRIAIIERSRSREDLNAGCCRVCGQPIGAVGREVLTAKATQVIAPRNPVWDVTPRLADHLLDEGADARADGDGDDGGDDDVEGDGPDAAA